MLEQLRSAQSTGHDLHFSISLLEVELQIRKGHFSRGMSILERLAQNSKQEEVDIFQRVKIMTLKARLYDKAGIPQKGFSIALRAAVLAHRTKLLPPLWEAINALCAILHSVQEYSGSSKLLEGIVPQVLECEACELAAQTFSLLADAHMGLAKEARHEPLRRQECLTKALDDLGRAFDEYSRIEDVRGQCEMLAKQATIMHLNGDPALANDHAAKYLAIQQAARDGD